MGCDIHIITEIKKSNKWERVPDVPAAFDERNYYVFAWLANVRNSFDLDGFRPRGLPQDISGRKFEPYELEDDEEEPDFRIDFDDGDYHSHSYLTLQEMLNKDKTDLLMEKCKVVRDFYQKFIELGGVIPDGMTVSDRRADSGTLIDAIRESFEPVVIVRWPSSQKKENNPVFIGINQLQEIANKYGVSPNCIRIVFAFDN